MNRNRTGEELSSPQGLEVVTGAELAETVGGVMPMWDPRTGQMVTCTDPRRWTPQFPPLSPVPGKGWIV